LDRLPGTKYTYIVGDF